MATANKRVSVVAGFALVAGLFTAAPALAYNSYEPFEISTAYSESVAWNAATEMYEWQATQISGTNNYVGFYGHDVADDIVFVTVTSGTIVNKIDAAAAGTLSAGNTVLTYTSGDLNNGTGNVFWVGTPTVGTITVKSYVRNYTNGVATDTQVQKFTITVIDGTKIGVPVASKTDFDVFAPGSGTETTADLSMQASTTSNAYSQFYVKTFDAYDVVTNKKVTATLSGPGNLYAYNGGDQYGKIVTSQLDLDGEAYFRIYSDGVSGPATITFSAGGVTLGTWKVVFYGTVASMVATTKIPHVVDDWSTNGVIELLVTDASGNPVPGVSPSVTYDTTKFDGVGVQDPTDSKGKTLVYVDPKSGTFGAFEFTFTSNSKTAKGSVTVTDEVAADITWALDRAVYAPGEKATLTITIKDKNGLLLGKYDGFDLFDNVGAEGLVTSSAITSVLAPYGDVDIAAGKATLTFFMPLGAGDFTISGIVDDDSDIATTLQGKTMTVTAKVVNADLDAIKAEQAKVAAAVAAVQATITALQTAITTLVASFTATLTLLQAKINKIMKKLGLRK